MLLTIEATQFSSSSKYSSSEAITSSPSYSSNSSSDEFCVESESSFSHWISKCGACNRDITSAGIDFFLLYRCL